MEKRKLGNTGTEVGSLGIGAMSFSDFYGPTDTEKSHAILKMALNILYISSIRKNNHETF